MEEMKEKSILVSVRVSSELYKEVKKAAIDKDDSVTGIVRRAFKMYIDEVSDAEKNRLFRLASLDIPGEGEIIDE